MFFNRKQKPKIRFFNSVPGVNTLHPVTRGIDLNREWVSYEKKEYQELTSKCPVQRLSNGLSSALDNTLPSELSSLVGISQDVFKHSVEKPTSIGKCPGINALMHNGFIIHTPADFSVYAENTEELNVYWNKDEFPQPNSISYGKEYVENHPKGQTKWLKDSCKDVTNDNILKIQTCWHVIADPDIVFLVMKVPYVKETRFSAVTGILDPTLCTPEVNIQLWWHDNSGKEITIKAGTPIAMYLPISRKLLEYNASISDATDDDIKMLEEYKYMNGMNFSENRSITKVARKIYKKYWKKYIAN